MSADHGNVLIKWLVHSLYYLLDQNVYTIFVFLIEEYTIIKSENMQLTVKLHPNSMFRFCNYRHPPPPVETSPILLPCKFLYNSMYMAFSIVHFCPCFVSEVKFQRKGNVSV